MGLAEFWFLLVAVLFVGYFVLEGFDFGVGMHVGLMTMGLPEEEKDVKRRVLLNTIGPVWDGNEVWVLTGGGALFAAFPAWYASALSAFYLPVFLLLIGLILRACAIEYRGKIDSVRWRRWWDRAIIVGSFIPALLWGVFFSGIIHGIALDADGKYVGGLIGLLSPYALVGGVTTLVLFLFHGAVFLCLKTAGSVRDDAVAMVRKLLVPTIALVLIFGVWTQLAYGGLWTWLAVLAVVAAVAGLLAALRAQRDGWAFVATSVIIAGAVALLFGSLYPNVLPTTLADGVGLTIANASSSHYTLVVMTWVALLLTPVVLLYQGWTYWVFRRRISTEHIPASIGLKGFLEAGRRPKTPRPGSGASVAAPGQP